MPQPQTRKDSVVDVLHGIAIPDPYRWLEKGADPNVIAWTQEQNDYADSVLRTTTQQLFSNELAQNFRTVNFSNPVPVAGRYFWTERQPEEDQSALYFKQGLEGESVLLLNPNGKQEGNTVSIDYWVPGWTGKYLVYGMSRGGDEMATLFVLNVDTRESLAESVPNCRYASVCWLPDDSGFFYTRNPKPGTVPNEDETLYAKVYLHLLGQDPDTDELIFGEGRPKDDMFVHFALSLDGRYLAMHVTQTWTENDIYLYDRQDKTVKPLVVGRAGKHTLSFLSNTVLLHTSDKASRYRVLSQPIDQRFDPLEQWNELVPEREALLEAVSVTSTRIILEYLVNACSELHLLDHAGHSLGPVPLPPFSSLSGVSTSPRESEFFYGVESHLIPKITYRYTDAPELYRATENPIDPESYITKQEWYVSKDGTRVPMFIFHKSNLSGKEVHPTLLYGYGGFASNMIPAFMRQWIPWLERGGVFAVANIRGGAEFGEQWHLDGIKEKKQNGFDDFIAAAEYLIAQKYTDTAHLGILGGSNGGLLVSAVAVQRPELYGAVCSRVPLTDMVRFPKFGMAMRWVHEYGNPEVKEELEWILKWSPYHNVHANKTYPPIFFTTGTKDTRVDPLHARKMAALFQSVVTTNPALVFTEQEAGHGPGKPISKQVDLQSLILSFFAQQLGLPEKK